jgi:hypothetical protein
LLPEEPVPGRHEIVDFELHEISLVDAPANKLAKVVIWKRAQPAERLPEWLIRAGRVTKRTALEELNQRRHTSPPPTPNPSYLPQQTSGGSQQAALAALEFFFDDPTPAELEFSALVLDEYRAHGMRRGETRIMTFSRLWQSPEHAALRNRAKRERRALEEG